MVKESKSDLLKEILNMNLPKEIEKKYIDLFTSTTSPKKLNLEKDEKLKSFFDRSKKYYKFLENKFSTLNNTELIKTFLYEIKIRQLHLERNILRFNPLIKLSKLTNEPKKILIKAAKDEYFYFKEFNPHIFNMYSLLSTDDEYFVLYKKTQITYIPFFTENIKNEISFLKLYKSYLNNEFNEDRKKRFENILQTEKNNEYRKKLIFYFNIEKLSKKELVEFIDDLINLLKELTYFDFITDMKMLKKEVEDKFKNEPYILNILKKYLADNIGTYNLISFGESQYSNNKFFVEIDFNIPEELYISHIKDLYKKYKKGEIQTFEEFILDKKEAKYKKNDELKNNYIFSIKNEKKMPLYVKLVDLLYIYDCYLLNIKQTFVIRQIENNRLFYENSFKSFSSTYKIYKKFIVDFVEQKQYNFYL